MQPKPELDGPAKFKKCLSGSTLRFWKHIVREEPGYPALGDRTDEAFQDAVAILRNKVCGEANMGETQMYYLAHDIKKPAKMNLKDFLNRFKEIVDCSKLLKGNYLEVTEHQEKVWFFHAFPKSYQEKFSESMFTIEEKTMEQIATYFQRLHAKEVKSGKFLSGDGQKRKREDDGESRRVSNKRQRGRDRRQGRKNYNEGRSNGNGNGQRMRFSDQCPNHPHLSHSWGECFGNPDSPNYRPPRFGNDGNSHRDGNSRGRDNKRSFSGGKDSRGNKRSGGRQDQSDVHHYEADASRSRSNKSASRRSASRQRSSSFSDESEHDNHYVEQTAGKRVMSSLFDDE